MLVNEHKRGRQSFEVLVVCFCVFSGATHIFTNRPPNNIAQAMDPQYQAAWSWCMLIAGVLALIGLIIKDEVTGSYFELGGMLGLGFGNLVYGIAVMAMVGVPMTAYAGSITIAIALSCFYRSFRLTRALWREFHQDDEERLVVEVKAQLSEAVEAEARMIVENREKGVTE